MSSDIMPDDIFFVNPFDVETPPEKPTEAALLAMAMSMASLGQRRPVMCRRSPSGHLVIVHGKLRAAAARLIRKGFNVLDEESGVARSIRMPRFWLKSHILDDNDPR